MPFPCIDAKESARSIELIWDKWLLKPGSILIPGHDLTMGLDHHQQPVYIGKREAGIRTWFSETIEQSELIHLC
jgi:hypothetical protein